jgi:hypothetical protein
MQTPPALLLLLLLMMIDRSINQSIIVIIVARICNLADDHSSSPCHLCVQLHLAAAAAAAADDDDDDNRSIDRSINQSTNQSLSLWSLASATMLMIIHPRPTSSFSSSDPIHPASHLHHTTIYF